MLWNDIIFMEKNFMIAKKNGYQNWIYFATTTKKSAVVREKQNACRLHFYFWIDSQHGRP